MADEYERTASRDEAAAVLRDVADGVAAGAVRFGGGDEAVAVDVPESIELEVEFETEDGVPSLEIELEWPETANEASAVDDLEDAPPGGPLPVGSAEPRESLGRFEVFPDRRGEWRWRLVHRNGNVIATGGEGYTRKHNAEKGLRSVMRNAPGAEIVEASDGDGG